MTTVPGIRLLRIHSVIGDGRTSHAELAERVAGNFRSERIAGVIAATFSSPMRFPSLAVRIASFLGLPPSVPAFDLQLACSAYPYAVFLAGRLASDLGGNVLVIDGDVQRPLVDPADHATGAIFSDAMTATLVTSSEESSRFDFLSSYDASALTCPAGGPIAMDGFGVFTFVATKITGFLKPFGDDFDIFAPHQANPYMIRQLAKSLNLTDRLVTIPEGFLNPGSCSVAMALEHGGRHGRALIAGFGAGYSACAGIVRYG